MQEVRRALGVGGGGEDEPSVVLQHLQPVGDIAGVVGSGLKLQTQIGAEERCAQFGDKLLAGVAFVAPAAAAEVSVKARRMPGPMDLMPRSA